MMFKEEVHGESATAAAAAVAAAATAVDWRPSLEEGSSCVGVGVEK